MIFQKKHSEETRGLIIKDIIGLRATKGEIGIEIEVEGNKFPKSSTGSRPAVSPELIPPVWSYHRDGSLRGEDNAEYVLKKPIKFSEVPAAVDALWKMFSDFGSVLTDSNRTSVHVHLNVQKFDLNRLCSFLALYFSVEEILTEWCGEHRVGNLFCLRAKDAPAIVSQVKQFLRLDGAHRINEHFHYAGLNAEAIFKFGSIEIRSLRGVTDPKIILDWVSILERIYTMSADFPDPRAIMENFSGNGYHQYLEMVLGDKLGIVLNNIEADNEEVSRMTLDGIRLAQELCYCRDWSLYKPMEEGDPFGRKKSSVSGIEAAIAAAEALSQVAVSPSPWPPAPASMPGSWSPGTIITVSGSADHYLEDNFDSDHEQGETDW